MGLSKKWKSALTVLLPENADILTVPGGDPAEELHCTLWFIGRAAESPVERSVLREACQRTAQAFSPVLSHVRGVSGLGNDDPQASVLLLGGSGPGMVHALLGSLVPNMPEPKFPNYTPHVTQGYGTPLDDSLVGMPIRFDRLALWWEDEREEFPLS